ncbi:MAG: hypothetical protein IPG63_12605 [Xanthomonadales bacterium]|nr:hypothetical protein [Xanthomonadales bacterium]
MRSRATNPRPAIQVHATADQPLGMAVEKFLANWWLKRPLLIRGMGGSDFASPITPDDLAGLACEDLVEAHLHTAVGRERGPFAAERLRALPEHGFALEVAEVDRFDRDVAAVLDRLGFLPRWRIRGVDARFAAAAAPAISYADPAGCLLLQAEGRTRLQVEEMPPAWQQIELQPSDALYLPPAVAATAQSTAPGLCLRIGFAAASAGELIEGLAAQFARDASERYADPGLAARRDPTAVEAEDMLRLRHCLRGWLQLDDATLARHFARFLSTHGARYLPAPRPRPLTRAQFQQRLARGAGLSQHPFLQPVSTPARRGRRRVALAGQEFETSTRLAALLARRELLATHLAPLDDAERADLLQWLNLGLIGFLS